MPDHILPSVKKRYSVLTASFPAIKYKDWTRGLGCIMSGAKPIPLRERLRGIREMVQWLLKVVCRELDRGPQVKLACVTLNDQTNRSVVCLRRLLQFPEVDSLWAHHPQEV